MLFLLRFWQSLHAIDNFRGSSNGRTPGFGPGYLGSNPGPRATQNSLRSWRGAAKTHRTTVCFWYQEGNI